MSAQVDGTGVTFRLADRPRRLAEVRLVHELGPEPSPFDRVAGEWLLRLDQPLVDRMEYLLEVTDHNGRRMTITDPDNPEQVPGAFGPKSVVEFRDYRPPAWLDASRCQADVAHFDIAGVTGELWSPSGLGTDEGVPLLVVHDGPEYARLGAFTDYLAALVAAETVPPLRAALLDPGDRNAWYAGNPEYAATLCTEVVPRLPAATARIGVGVSLGALAMLHAQRSYRGTFAGLFLQSGSFFTPSLDPQESGFTGFAAVTAFTESVAAAAGPDDPPIPITLTCGLVEENRANNAAMAATLRRLGNDATLHLDRDAHNYVAWRDALDPRLPELIRTVAGARAA